MSFQQDTYPQANPPADYVPVQATVDGAGRPILVEQPVVQQPVIVQPAPEGSRQFSTSYVGRFAIDSIIVAAVGLALTVVGLLAVTRAGIHGPMNSPVVKVLGFTHTESLGILETAIGVLLLICAAATSRSASIFFGLILGVGGFIGAVQTKSFTRSLALESGLAWLAVFAAVLVVAASLVVPRIVTRSTRVGSL
jgi:hypothetical protein